MIHALFVHYAETAFSQAIRNSSWAFAVVEMAHLLALAILGGALLTGVLGLTGLALQFPGRTDGWQGLRALVLWAFVATVATGVLLVGSNPLKYYFNDAFRAKALLLAFALLLTIATDLMTRSRFSRIAAFIAPLSLLGWLGVALAGRLIGLL